jgi:hypothetical protein
MLMSNDFTKGRGWKFVSNRKILDAWVELQSVAALVPDGKRNLLKMSINPGDDVMLFYFPENTVLVIKEKPL